MGNQLTVPIFSAAHNVLVDRQLSNDVMSNILLVLAQPKTLNPTNPLRSWHGLCKQLSNTQA